MVSLTYMIVQRLWTQEVLGFDTFPPFYHQKFFPVCAFVLFCGEMRQRRQRRTIPRCWQHREGSNTKAPLVHRKGRYMLRRLRQFFASCCLLRGPRSSQAGSEANPKMLARSPGQAGVTAPAPWPRPKLTFLWDNAFGAEQFHDIGDKFTPPDPSKTLIANPAAFTKVKSSCGCVMAAVSWLLGACPGQSELGECILSTLYL